MTGTVYSRGTSRRNGHTMEVYLILSRKKGVPFPSGRPVD